MKLSDNTINLLTQRYLRKDLSGNLIETPEEMFRRVAHAVANAEEEPNQWENKFYDLMYNLEFMPNSPTLMNAGDEGCLSACFVLPIEDSMESIFDAIKSSALVNKSGGGVGYSFSKLRPEGSRVKSTNGVASGPISFMEVFNSATDVIKQGGRRRGANMGILRVDHPDIMNFITCKDDNTKLNTFNISVAITHEFMSCVKNDEDYSLIDPSNNNEVSKISARLVWDKIAEQAWKNGEPGIVFIDRINSFNTTPHLGNIESTNPCVTGDTPILTKDGYTQIKDVVGEEVEIWNGYEFSKVTPRITGKNQDIVRVNFSDGSYIDCTPYHKFIIQGSDERIKAKNLKEGMKLEKFYYPIIEGSKDMDPKEAYTYGVVKGNQLEELDKKEVAPYINDIDSHSMLLYKNAEELLPYLHYTDAIQYITKSSENSHLDPGKFIPDCEYKIKVRLAWLSGILDSNIGTSGSKYCSILSKDKGFLMSIKYMVHTLGLSADLSYTKQGWSLIIKGRHVSRGEPVLSNLANIELGATKPNAIHKPISKDDELIEITSIEHIGTADTVYCFTEPKRNKGMFGCVTAGQCGEQPLHPWESCTLGSINLSKMVVNGKMDMDKLSSTVSTAVRFLDDVIEINEYPLDIISQHTRATRRIGLGVMGWAEALIKLNTRYDSEEATNMAKEIMRLITSLAREVSINLAEERGVFPAYHDSTFECDDIKIRHAGLTTIAPTGSISMICETSSGIEPLFGVGYVKNVMDGEKLLYINPLFEEAVDKLSFGDSVKKEIKEYAISSGSPVHLLDNPAWDTSEVRSLVNLFRCAHDVSPEWHVKMQAAFQAYTDNAVSKTINFNKDVSVADVKAAYELANSLGCKGITVYRDGSREGQVYTSGTETSEEDDGVCEVIPRPRPRRTYGSTVSVKTGCDKIYLTINEDEHGLCETFARIGSKGGCAGLTDGISRMISLALRAGIPVQYIIDQLRSIRCDIAVKNSKCKNKSCPDAIGKELEHYVFNGVREVVKELTNKHAEYSIEQNESSGEPCPECGKSNLLDSGCYTCIYCGYSKCS